MTTLAIVNMRVGYKIAVTIMKKIYGDGKRLETEEDDSCSAIVFSVDEHDLQNYADYISILKLSRELPKYMCVVEIMSTFG